MKKILSLSLLLGLLFPLTTGATSFNPGNILSTTEFTDYDSMSTTRIRNFLTARGGTLGSYNNENYSGVTKSAAEIIFDAAWEFFINPKVLIVTLQKEQSLVTDSTPSQRQYDWATGYGVCDDCSTSDPAIQQYKGFGKQVYWAAKQNRRYLDLPQNYRYQVGQTYDIDGQRVTIENQATAAFYNYTPHLAGNQNFWSLYTSWFPLPHYPDGSLLRIEGQAGIWLIQNGLRKPFWSRSAFLSSYDPRRVIDVSSTELEAYEIGDPIKFSNYSLLKTPAGHVFLLVDGSLKQINSPETFRRLGFNPEEILEVTEQEIASYPRGPKITLNSIHPAGALLQATNTGGIFYVENGVKHAIWSQEILRSQYKNRPIISARPDELETYELGEPVKFKDGEIVTSPSSRSVYVISNGEKRPIDSLETFQQLGYQWENLIRTTDDALRIHPTGELVTVATEEQIE